MRALAPSFAFSVVGVALLLLAVACVPPRQADAAESAELRPSEISEPAPSPSTSASASAPAAASSTGSATAASATAPTATSAEGGVLSRTALIRAVLARNPEIESRRQALRAAKARRRQVTALDDPELSYSFAPMSIGSSAIFGQSIQLSQRFPWPGKRSSLGDSAEFDAAAAREDVRVTELELALEASMLFDDYYLVDRALEVNEHHRHLLRELKSIAQIQLEVGRASIQDPLQAEVELSRLAEQDETLRAERVEVTSSLNALLHRAPGEALPPPPRAPDVPLDLPPSEAALEREAVATSPELRGLKARGRAFESQSRYAAREYYPDFTLMASYSTMYMPEHRLMVGASTPIPIQTGRRGGLRDEADARIAEVRATSARELDRIRAAVSVARQRVVESVHVVQIFDKQMLPAAEARVSAARADYMSGPTTFFTVVDGEKNLREAELTRYGAIADLGKRRAKLDRAVGRIPFSGRAARER